MKNDKHIILDLLYSVNNADYYVKVFSIEGTEKKIKITRREFIEWCEKHYDDDQGWEISEYLRYI